jgi:hypothetical protein
LSYVFLFLSVKAWEKCFSGSRGIFGDHED